jgi:hypothetical protein
MVKLKKASGETTGRFFYICSDHPLSFEIL